ncbi:3-hydroxyacyl-ACP dehydratase FabZ family protein [Lacticaseibacillus sp. GG6-2]
MSMMDGLAVQARIPNRYPIFHVDKVMDLQPDRSVVIEKYLTHAESHINGYRPDNPQLANSLMIEMMAQAASVLILESPLFVGKTAYLAAINNAEFPQTVQAGNCLTIAVKMVKVRQTMGVVRAEATIQAQPVASAELHFVVADVGHG